MSVVIVHADMLADLGPTFQNLTESSIRFAIGRIYRVDMAKVPWRVANHRSVIGIGNCRYWRASVRNIGENAHEFIRMLFLHFFQDCIGEMDETVGLRSVSD